MKQFRRYLILSHRYLGIPLSGVFILWFISGIVMMYTGGMPSLTEVERLQRSAPLDLTEVRVTPAQASAAAGTEALPDLQMLAGRPAYRFPGSPLTAVFADTTEHLRSGQVDSHYIAAEFMGVDPSLVTRTGLLEETDQWTLELRDSLPLQHFEVADGRGSQVYVSPQRGEVLLHTDMTDRLLAWAGAIPHWFYLESLRENQRLWVRAVVWTSTLACVFVVLGLLLSVTQFRRVRPFNLGKSIPYRGAHRWHYILGSVFGVLTLTWAFSGLLSMEPYRWTTAQGMQLPPNLLRGEQPALESFDRIAYPSSTDLLSLQNYADLKQVRPTTIQGQPYFELVFAGGDSAAEDPPLQTRLVHAGSLEERTSLFDADALQQVLETASMGVPVEESRVLDEYDNYYYPRNNYQCYERPLPVLRVKFDDPLNTWYYVNLRDSRIVATNHRLSRTERWLFSGLHSLDFRFWYGSRPLWDIGMMTLLCGGLLLSVFGFYLGWLRIVRYVADALRRQAPDLAERP